MAKNVTTIVDYGAGNLTSVERALAAIGAQARVSSAPDRIRKSDRVIFPGVGAAGQAMGRLRETGLDEALKEVFKKGNPILGICIGCQIIMDESVENSTTCLGLLPGRTVPFPNPLTDSGGERLKVPHMGWNGVEKVKDHPLFAGVNRSAEFYFVHGFHPRPEDSEQIYGQTDYGIVFPSVIGRDNLVAVQFHVEKSGRPGLAVLENFTTWTP
jgi:imidazole glycerol-phosphate synthase subunit HisH